MRYTSSFRGFSKIIPKKEKKKKEKKKRVLQYPFMSTRLLADKDRVITRSCCMFLFSAAELLVALLITLFVIYGIIY